MLTPPFHDSPATLPATEFERHQNCRVQGVTPAGTRIKFRKVVVYTVNLANANQVFGELLNGHYKGKMVALGDLSLADKSDSSSAKVRPLWPNPKYLALE